MKTSSFRVLGLLGLASLASSLAAQPLVPGPEILVQDKLATGLDLAAGASGGSLVAWGAGTTFYERAYSPAEQPAEIRPVGAHWAFSAAAGLATGGYVTLWNRQEPPAPSRLVARLLDAAGRPVSDVLDLAPQSAYPAVAARPAGGFQVVRSYQNRLLVQRYDRAGAPEGGETVAAPSGELPSIASLPNGGFVVAWAETATSTLGRQIVFRVFGPDGAPAGPAVVLGAHGAFWAGPKVTTDAAGRFVIAWSESLSTNAHRRVRAQRFSPGGEALGPILIVAQAPEADRAYSLWDVAARPDGSFLVLFDRRQVHIDGIPGDDSGYGEIPMVRAYDAAGAPLGDAILASDRPSEYLSSGAVEASAEGWTASWSLGSFVDRTWEQGVYLRSFSTGCGGTASTLCLGGGRFRVEVAWKTGAGEGVGTPIPLTDDTGAFWFFSPSNYELNVKILDGRSTNGRFWVFYGSLTDVEFDLTVTDTATGQQRTYHNPQGTMASRADTSAF